MHAILLPASRITRLLNSYCHPDQAAIASRLPFAGRRVPIRAFWRRQDIKPRRMFEHAVSQDRGADLHDERGCHRLRVADDGRGAPLLRRHRRAALAGHPVVEAMLRANIDPTGRTISGDWITLKEHGSALRRVRTEPAATCG